MDKSLILSLWDYQYTWEIYTPAEKRKYGYYTLPVIFGDRFIGRIEIIPDRKKEILEVRRIWWEPGVRQTKKLEAVLNKTVKEFARFNGCKEYGAGSACDQPEQLR